jgi:hypothetical protein
MSALAQAIALVPAVKAVTPLVVDGKTIQETSFKLSSFKCKAVMVCKMLDPRNSYEGPNGQPLDLVVVSIEACVQGLLDCERTIICTVPLKQRFIRL